MFQGIVAVRPTPAARPHIRVMTLQQAHQPAAKPACNQWSPSAIPSPRLLAAGIGKPRPNLLGNFQAFRLGANRGHQEACVRIARGNHLMRNMRLLRATSATRRGLAALSR